MKPPKMNKELQQTDDLLAEIWRAESQIRYLVERTEEEVKLIRERYHAQISQFQEHLSALKKELIGLMKSNQAAIFDGRDKVSLEHGWLIYRKEWHVSIPKDKERVIEIIEAYGWTEAIRIAKSVDRGVVEAWPEERLVVINARRRIVEKYAYETKEGKDA